MLRICLLALAGLLASTPAAATVYRWVDANGHVHFSDKPAAMGVEQLAVNSEPTDPARIEAEQQAREEQAAAEAEAAEEASAAAEESAREAQNREIRKRNCDRARSHYQQILQAQRPYEMTPDGERAYLTAEEIEAKRDSARASIDEWCD